MVTSRHCGIASRCRGITLRRCRVVSLWLRVAGALCCCQSETLTQKGGPRPPRVLPECFFVA